MITKNTNEWREIMEGKKVIIADTNWVAKKLENWRCLNCGSRLTPMIVSKEDEDEGESDLELYIKCPDCGKIIQIKQI